MCHLAGGVEATAAVAMEAVATAAVTAAVGYSRLVAQARAALVEGMAVEKAAAATAVATEAALEVAEPLEVGSESAHCSTDRLYSWPSNCCHNRGRRRSSGSHCSD